MFKLLKKTGCLKISYFLNKTGGVGLVVALSLLVVVTSVGLMSITPLVKTGVITDTLGIIEKNIDYIISYASENKRLPTTVAYTIDGYGNDLIYAYADELASTNNICGRNNTVLSESQESKAVALIIASMGENGTVDSTNLPSSSQAIKTTTSVTLSKDDLYKYLTLETLQQKIGCYGTTRGKIMIVNNELPAVCQGSTNYSAIVYADGGVPFNTYDYKWCFESTLPSWLSATPNTSCPSWSSAASNLALTAISAANGSSIELITFRVKDNESPTPNTAKRTLSIAIDGSCSGGSNGGGAPGIADDPEITFDDIISYFTEVEGYTDAITADTSAKTLRFLEEPGGGVGNDDEWGCAWFPDGTHEVSPCSTTSCPIVNRTTRVYFDMITDFVDGHAQSKDYKGGFTFAFIEGDSSPPPCGGPGNGLGYDKKNNNVGNQIPGYSFALEFDMYPDSGSKDFYYDLNAPGNPYKNMDRNHLAMIFNGENEHKIVSLPANPLCPEENGGDYTCWSGCCVKNGSDGAIWLEDAQTHNVRIELHTRCDSLDGGANCINCDSGSGNYAAYKVWIDASSSDDISTDYIDEEPFINKCFEPHYDTMSTIKFGFTVGIFASKPKHNPFTISNFKIIFDSSDD